MRKYTQFACVKNVNSLRTGGWFAVDGRPQFATLAHQQLTNTVQNYLALPISPTLSTGAFPQRFFAIYLSKIAAFPHYPQHLLLSLHIKKIKER